MSLRLHLDPREEVGEHLIKAIQEYLEKYENDQNVMNWREADQLHNLTVDIKNQLR